MGYSKIQRFANIKSRSDASNAIAKACDAKYIARVEDGVFHYSGKKQAAASYAPCWAVVSERLTIGSKNEPAIVPKKRTSKATKSVPVEQFNKRTSIKSNSTKQNYKQDAVVEKLFFELTKIGFGESDGKQLLQKHQHDSIQKQLRWLKFRNATNPAGMLRRAVEENWSAPAGSDIYFGECRNLATDRNQMQQQQGVYDSRAKMRFERRVSRLKSWNELTGQDHKNVRQRALKIAVNDFTRRRLQQCSFENPNNELLEEMERYLTAQ